MMISPRLACTLVAFAVLHGAAAEPKCNPKIDKDCTTAETGSQRKTSGKKTIEYHYHDGKGEHPAYLPETSPATSPATAPARTPAAAPAASPAAAPATAPAAQAEIKRPLQPVRAYLRAADIPPQNVGAYGLVVFQSRPTSANRAKLLMVCKSFVAHFPPSEKSSVPSTDQMVTIWPVEKPDAQEMQRDDCDFALDNYDLVAAEAAISDATLQHADFSGDGPFLVGWSPSKARAVPDALVLVIDMSSANTQDAIDYWFRFWKNEIVQDPSKWRGGFSVERIRVAARAYADTYGQAIMDGLKFFTGKP